MSLSPNLIKQMFLQVVHTYHCKSLCYPHIPVQLSTRVTCGNRDTMTRLADFNNILNYIFLWLLKRSHGTWYLTQHMDSMKTKVMIYLQVNILCLTMKEKIYQGCILIHTEFIGYYHIVTNFNLYYRYHDHHKINYSF